jgi:hypothetical protein
VQRGVAGLVAVVLLTGCGSGARYAGLTRDEAAAGSRQAARGIREPVLVADMWGSRKRVPVGTWRSRTSDGRAAWLTVFSLTGVVNDTDQACVWAWRDVPGPASYEEVASVSYGPAGDAAHDRCASEVRARGIAPSGQAAGSEVQSPPVASPEVVAPFGAWQARISKLDYAGGSAMTLTGNELLLPVEVPPGTCGFAGFVIDERTSAPIRGARVAVSPAGGQRGILTTTDDLGAFAFSGLPVVARGFDFTVRAATYKPSHTVDEECYPGDYAIGDWPLVHGSPVEGTTSFAAER